MNNLLDKLGIRLPIIQAPMAGVSTPAMAAAVSNAGGLGSIGIGSVDAEAAHGMIAAVRAISAGPLNVNVFCHQPAVRDAAREAAWLARLAPHFAEFRADPPRGLREVYTSFVEDDAALAMLLEERPRVVSFHFGLPTAERIAALRAAGIVLLATATNLAEARCVRAAGIDAVVAQGCEAGGHRGVFDPDAADECLPTLELVRQLVREIDIPVIAAGGLMDGADIATALRAGASAAQLGTAFVGCAESAADAGYRRALFDAKSNSTVMTRAISGRPARCLANRFTAIGEQGGNVIVPAYPVAYDAAKSLHVAARAAGEFGYGAQWAGTGAAKARALTTAELIERLRIELEQSLRTS